MAGIGFQLNQLLARRTFTGALQAYGYAALISSGPWILSIVSLAVLGLMLEGILASADLELFFVTVAHVYAFSLILTGPVQLVLTRYLADRLYLRQQEKLFGTYMAALTLTAAISMALGLAGFMVWVPAPFLYQAAAALLFVLVSSIWISVVFLSVTKNYHLVFAGFALGYGVGFGLAWWFSHHDGAGGAMTGFVVGQALMLLVFTGILYRQFGRGQMYQVEFLKFFKPYAPLALAGLFYNLGIWSDKFIFWWFSPIQVHVAGVLYAAPVYDMAVYLSFLSLVPGLAIFLVNLETDYALKCERFIQRVLKKGTLRAITEAKGDLIESLQQGLEKLVKVQVVFTGCLIVFAEPLLSLLNLGMVETGIFQVVMLGAFMLMIYLVFLTILFYLNRLRAACWSCVIFFLTNTTVTSYNVLASERWYGVGFVAAGCLAAVFAAVCVHYYHQNLEYYTFTEQIRG